MGEIPGKARQYSERAYEIRLIADTFCDEKDRQTLLQYADEIEQLASDCQEAKPPLRAVANSR
jgi:hypothetical protein